ncbi:FkbM family methyltransferase [Deltaproteobacteria bacterium OttesenSCG-928-K17]|nr:FkbM family methyltransferase [Deltaproteobacteria bacterium OttesenSCG-928-K17]
MIGFNNIFIEDFMKYGPTAATPDDLFAYLDRIEAKLKPYIDNLLSRLMPLSPNREIAIFGAGLVGRQMKLAFDGCGLSARAFCDNNPDLRGSSTLGLPVVSAEQIAVRGRLKIVTAVSDPAAAVKISSQLQKLGLDADDVIMPHQTIPELIPLIAVQSNLAVLNSHRAEITAVFDLMPEPKSRYIYLNSIKACFSMPSNEACVLSGLLAEGNQYWALPEFRNNSGSTYVDCGSGVGENLFGFLFNNDSKTVKGIYAFEPIETRFELLKQTGREISRSLGLGDGVIKCLNYMLGRQTIARSALRNEAEDGMLLHSQVSARTNPQDSDGAERVELQMLALDDYFKDIPVSMIKADIEGFEMEMLTGAAGLIKSQRPRLAICLYHRPQDVYEIPLYLRSLVPDYEMAVRHHAVGPSEFVLYCW